MLPIWALGSLWAKWPFSGNAVYFVCFGDLLQVSDKLRSAYESWKLYKFEGWCNGKFCVSIWVTRMPRLKIILVCLWGCFWLKLALQFVDSWSRLSPTVWIGVIQSTEGLNRAKDGRQDPSPFLSYRMVWNITPFLLSDWDLHHWLPWFSGLHFQTDLQHQLSWLCSLQAAHRGTSQPPHAVRQLFKINHSITPSLSPHTPLVLFFWITLTNAGKGRISDPFRASRKLLL